MILEVLLSVLVMLVIVLASVQVTLSTESTLSEGQLTALEAGFETILCLKSLSAPFFSLAVLFVLFDVELVFFFPLILSLNLGLSSLYSSLILLFLVILTLFLEWVWYGLKWQV